MSRDPRGAGVAGSPSVVDDLKAAKARLRAVWIIGIAVWVASMLFLAVAAPARWMAEYSVPVSVIPAAIAVYIAVSILSPKKTA